MSVAQYERRTGQLKAPMTAKDLCEYTLTVTNSKKVIKDFSINRTLERLVLAIYGDVLEAAELCHALAEEREHRLFLKRRAAARCRTLLAFIDVTCSAHGIDPARVEHWTNLARSVRNEITAWITDSE